MPSSFIDGTAQPSDAELDAALGRAKKHWDTILAAVEKALTGATQKWMFYGKKHGWQLKVTYKKRSLLYMIPQEKSFLAGLALPQKALAQLADIAVPAELVAEIKGSKKYSEGWPARVVVTNKKHATTVQRLVALKASVM
jgi:hypothetical protein